MKHIPLLIFSGLCLLPGIALSNEQNPVALTGYIYMNDFFQSCIKCRAKEDLQSDSLQAVIELIDQNICVAPAHIACQALIDLNDTDYKIRDLISNIKNNDPDVVFDFQTARKRCKQFNQLCVKGNVLICGNLLVCNQICGISCDPSSNGNPGATGNTGPTGITGFTGNQGALGARGIQGATGDTGPQGATGLTGFTASTGAQGNTGLTGNASVGPTGFTGFTATTGVSGLSEGDGAFAFIYTTGATSITGGSGVAEAGAVPFSTAYAITGIAYTPGSSALTILTSGIYEISYVITSPNASQFALYQNDTVIEASRYFISTNQQLHGQTLVPLNAGDIITLRNETTPNIATPTTVNLVSNSGSVSASILIVQDK
ncbi:hypothetical protein Noda2021_07040 [Candidatus Dependentiae bacterium Noda2021]|nr:hypothetical protein Noda2021_07040 [Candidatus Dependentiae bacterium Noda2021]